MKNNERTISSLLIILTCISLIACIISGIAIYKIEKLNEKTDSINKKVTEIHEEFIYSPENETDSEEESLYEEVEGEYIGD